MGVREWDQQWGQPQRGTATKAKASAQERTFWMVSVCGLPFIYLFIFCPKAAGQILAPSAGSGGSGPDPVRLQEPAGGMGMGRGGLLPHCPQRLGTA